MKLLFKKQNKESERTNMRKMIPLIIVLLISITAFASADTVAKIGDTEYETLAEALNVAIGSGDTIEVVSDTDLGDGSYIIENNDVTINGNNHTVGISSSVSIYVVNRKELNFNDIVLDGGTTEISGYSSQLISVENATLSLTNSTIQNRNTAGINTLSSVIYIDSNGTFSMVDSYIQNCKVGESGIGLISAVGIGYDGGSITINGGGILNCGSLSGNDSVGGALLVLPYNSGAKSKVDIQNATFSGNTADYGGALYLLDLEPIDVLIQNTTFLNNTSVKDGGAIVLYNATGTISKCVFSDNSGQNGGAVYSENSSVTFIDNTITGNISTNYGGGIYKENSSLAFSGKNLICNNTASAAGADIYNNDGSITLISATGMDEIFDSTRFLIDGWYADEEGERWQVMKSYSGTNQYLGDAITISEKKGIIAAFTAYDEIEITKAWDDENDLLGTRPGTMTFNLVDATTLELVKLRTYDETSGAWIAGGADATITLNTSDNWTGTIRPLLVNDYKDTSKYLLQEEDTGDLYVLKEGDPVITYSPDESGGVAGSNPGVYSASFTNIGRVPVTIYKIWDDASDIDGKRPSVLNVDLRMNGLRLENFDGTEAFYSLTATDGWQKKVYLPVKDYTDMTASEGTISDYTLSSKAINHNNDGTFSVVLINKHTLEPAATDTIRNENMVEIHYQAAKVWSGTNPVGDKQLPRPEITVILYADGVEVARQVIPANADPATATFSNVPKYKDNDGNEPITYAIKEEISDAGWVKVGDNLWYSLDGMGKYEGNITDVTATDVGNTDPLNTLTGGTATNTYTTLQTTTTVDVTKLWKDHQNENGVRPEYLKLGLFENESDADPVAVVTINGPMADDAWNGTFRDLPIYDANGQIIDYSTYVVKEAYPATLNPDGTPASWSAWVNPDETYTITKDGNGFDYDYSVVTTP